ncbi:MAG: hypothetical protein FJ138_01265 [Deltaproteobacteria bacterium]|nr:hypothetical protein [Deltaproteobacteria bacterium]
MKRLITLLISLMIVFSQSNSFANPLQIVGFLLKHKGKIKDIAGAALFVHQSLPAKAEASGTPMGASMLILNDALKSKDKSTILANERYAVENLTNYFIHDETESELKSGISLLIGMFYEDRNEHLIAFEWYKRSLMVNIKSGFFQSYSKSHLAIKSASAQKICLNEKIELADRFKSCAIFYSYNALSENAKSSHIESLERCVVLKNLDECAHHGTRIVSSLVQKTEDKESNKIETIFNNDNKVILVATLYAFLPYQRMIDAQLNWENLSNSEIVQFYWMSVALEALDETDQAKKSYIKLCSLNSRQGEFNHRIKRSCEVLSKEPFWSNLSHEEKTIFVLHACLKHQMPNMCIRSAIEPSLIPSNMLSNFIETISSGYVKGGGKEYYVAYLLLFRERLDMFTRISSMQISTRGLNGEKWDLIGSPEFFMKIVDSSGSVIFDFELNANRSDDIYFYIDTPSVDFYRNALPTSTQHSKMSRIVIYEKDASGIDVVLDQYIDLTTTYTVQNSVVSGLTLSPIYLSGDDLPFNKMISDLKK